MSLSSLIQKRCPLSVADYMALCLGHETYGYYMRKDPFGVQGDFITAPEISQIFGELIGMSLVHEWQMMGSPKALLAELGPGRGTLMADLLRATKSVPGFHDALSVQMIEMSPVLRETQQEKLKASHPRIRWHAELQLSEQPLLLIANEFFDALPIRQFSGDVERMIELHDDELEFSCEDITRETCDAAQAIMAAISTHIATYGGYALAIDYGYTGGTRGDTLQALKKHQYHEVLENPGEADITAHVDFDALRKAAEAQNTRTYITSQGDFLTRLGAGIRAQQLCAKATAEQKIAIVSGVERLISVDKMGDLFKVLAITHPDHPAPEGF